MKRTSCAICGGPLELRLDLGDSPLADDFRPNQRQALELPRYPLELWWCTSPSCSLVQLGEQVPDDILWGGDYGFYTGSSSVAVKHFNNYAIWLQQTYPVLLRGNVVEIACNDGILMREIAMQTGWRGRHLIGIDPAAGPVEAAAKRGLDARHESFDLPTAVALRNEIGHADLIIANNVIAHVTDLHDFAEAIAFLLDPLGVAVIEFQYLGDLVRNAQIDHVYHEHRQFFSLTSVQALFDRVGLSLAHVDHVDTQGGSLRVVMQKVGWPDWSVHQMLATERAWVAADPLATLQARANEIRSELRAMVRSLNLDGQHVVGYGASAKSTTLLNWCEIRSDQVPYFVDTTPTKYGRYTPGTGIPIIDVTADSRRPDFYLMTIWNYAREIMRRERGAGYTGAWIVPIPRPRVMSA